MTCDSWLKVAPEAVLLPGEAGNEKEEITINQSINHLVRIKNRQAAFSVHAADKKKQLISTYWGV